MTADTKVLTMTRMTMLAASIACCLSAQGQAQLTPMSRTVSLADLNLAQQADREILDMRLTKAAIAVCGVKSIGDGVGNERIDACRTAALAKGRRDAEVRIAAGAATVRLAARKD